MDNPKKLYKFARQSNIEKTIFHVYFMSTKDNIKKLGNVIATSHKSQICETKNRKIKI